MQYARAVGCDSRCLGAEVHPTTMQVFRFTTLDELEPYAGDWDRLAAGVPFRSWDWLSSWWRHYGQDDYAESPRTRLAVLGVFDDANTLVGLAPWRVDVSAAWGRVIRPLGSGEVCSDYLGLLCQADKQHQVAAALAAYLTEQPNDPNADNTSRDRLCWDLLELGSVDAEDLATAELIRQMAQRRCKVDRRPGPSCWRIELPDSWEDYLAMLSKSHRKQLRRLEQEMLATGRAVLHVVERLGELPPAVEILVRLHQRRRNSLGQPGCFASRRFAAFHRDVMPRLLCSGRLHLSRLEIDGRPAAAEYQLAGGGVVYAYQSGVDPELLDAQPGRLITLATLRRAIRQGFTAFDFLRGDEPYKPHFRARPRTSLEIRVVPHRAAARLRDGLRRTGRGVKHLIKSSLKLRTCLENPDRRTPLPLGEG